MSDVARDGDQPFQVMPEMDDEEFERIKSDIEENGIEYPIIVDGEGEVIDGHHRLRAWTELGRDPGEIPTRIRDESDSKNHHRAYRTNLLGRDLSDGTKREVVEDYLLEHPERIDEDSEREIASDLGVSRMTVSRATKSLREDGKLEQLFQLPTDEKREIVREYADTHPNASNRDVAESVECDVSYRTVGNWRNEWSDGDHDKTTGLDTFTASADEKDSLLDITSGAHDGDEEAQEQVEKIDSGEQTITGAKRAVEDTDDSDVERDEDDTRDDVDLFTSQETDEWSSPREVVEPIAEAIGEFTLDPCSGAEQSPFADETYTEDDDGLSQSWHGDVWVNPPYSDMAAWTEKAVDEAKRDGVERVVYLCKGDSSTKWWQSAMEQAEAVCAIDGRLSFGDGGNAAPFASHIFVFGALSAELAGALREQGALLAEVGGDDCE